MKNIVVETMKMTVEYVMFCVPCLQIFTLFLIVFSLKSQYVVPRCMWIGPHVIPTPE